MYKRVLSGTFAVALLAAAPAFAQDEFHRFSVAGGAGFTSPIGPTGRNVNLGWNVAGGAGINFTPNVGVMVNLGFSDMGVNQRILDNLGVGGGSMSVFSATLDPIVHLNPKGRFDFYLTGGGGLYHRYQNFTQPSVEFGTGFDPFFGFYQFAAPTNVIVASYTVNKPGVDAGAGVSFGKKWGGHFFAEAKYNYIFIGNQRSTTYIPVTFGFRW